MAGEVNAYIVELHIVEIRYAVARTLETVASFNNRKLARG